MSEYFSAGAAGELGIEGTTPRIVHQYEDPKRSAMEVETDE